MSQGAILFGSPGRVASRDATTAGQQRLRTSSNAGLRVLIVDDEPMVAATLADIVADSGGEVVGVISLGLASVGAASVIRPDVVLMDVRLLPGLDGIDAAAIIRERRWTPIVFISGVDVRDEVALRLPTLDGIAILPKPIDTDALCDAILRVASAHGKS